MRASQSLHTASHLTSDYEQKKKQILLTLSPLLQSDPEKKANGLELKKNTSNLFRGDSTPAKYKIDLRNFKQVISIDTEAMVAEIEAMATYEEIVRETLKYSCLPAVVPELKSITIGGALSGVGIESSSFKYGLVHETVLEYEVLLPDGRIVCCRPDNEFKDLFYAFPNSYGTLGYALKVKVKLIPAKKYVKLSHIHFENAADYFMWLEKTCAQQIGGNSENEALSKPKIDYIDGVVFDRHNFYVTLGEFVDEAPFVSDYKYMNIYYKSIRKFQTDYLSTLDYIWRWDSDWFWCSKHFMMENRVLRALFGKFMLKSTSYWKLRHFFNHNKIAKKIANWRFGSSESIIQDVEIPVHRAEEFLQFFQDKIGITPIWICPIKPYHKSSDTEYSFYKMDPNKLYINFGFWDVKATEKNSPLGFYNRMIEKKVQELGGNKSLYSSVYYTEEEFWHIYDRDVYKKLKNKYDSKLRNKDLYHKCTSLPTYKS